MAQPMSGQTVPAMTEEERRRVEAFEKARQAAMRPLKTAQFAREQGALEKIKRNGQEIDALPMQQAERLSRMSGGSTTARPEKPGLLSRITRRTMDALQDPVANAQIVAALNSLRFQPDPNLTKAVQARAAGVQERRTQAQEANRTVAYLQKMGRPDLAGVVEANPALAGEALKAIMGVSTDQFATKGFEPKVDPATGQIYGVQYDPNTGRYTRVDVPGATGETPTEKQARESAAALELQDFEAAQEAGVRAFTQAQQADRTIGTMYTAINAIDTGGRSGALDQFLPAFDAATATLRNAATTMGIDIINSATFGALSESELRLALSSGIPLGLEGNELKEFLYRKIEAQTLLRNELLRTAQMLSGGQMKYSDFINQYKVGGGTKPISAKQVTPKELGR